VVWEKWFAGAGVRARATPVASFNDVGLMLQATEQGLGLAVVRELLAADALRDGRLARLFDASVTLEGVQSYSFVFPPALKDWAPLLALRAWVREEFDASLATLVTLEASAR
jgi:LysR family glycine cleavage system transcriptional activator